jgi:hypothetical protein
MKGDFMRYHILILLLIAIITAGCIGESFANITSTITPTPTPTPTPNEVVTIITQQSYGINISKQTNIPSQYNCTPPRLNSGWKMGHDFPQSCIGTNAPIFTVPKYPAGPIMNESVVGKFYWWSEFFPLSQYMEFRDDGIWILYSSDNQTHYYPGMWKKWEREISYTSNTIHGYIVTINRPSATGQNYNETIIFTYNTESGRLILRSYDGVVYNNIDAWTTRYTLI